MTITIILLFCWILYRTGKAAELLEVFRLNQTTRTASPKGPEVSGDPPKPQGEPTPERLKLEAVAMNILLYKGVDTAPARVKRLNDSDLQNIIETFKSEIYL